MIVKILVLNEKTWQIDIEEEYYLTSTSKKKINLLMKNFYSKHLLEIYDWHKIKKILKNA